MNAVVETTNVDSPRAPIRASVRSAAWTNSDWFNSATVCSPKRRVSLTSVVGWGTRPPSGMRQNRCQEIESATSRHSSS